MITPPFFLHGVSRRLDPVKNSVLVDGNGSVVLLRRHVQHGDRWIADPGIVEHDVQPSEKAESLLYQRLHAFIIGGVRMDEEGCPPFFHDLGRRPLPFRAVNIPHHHFGALSGQLQSRGTTDSLRPAGDDGHPVLQPHLTIPRFPNDGG